MDERIDRVIQEGRTVVRSVPNRGSEIFNIVVSESYEGEVTLNS